MTQKRKRAQHEDPICRLSKKELITRLARIRAVLWPDDEPSVQWDSETLDDVARVLLEPDLRRPMTTCCLCHADIYVHMAHSHQGKPVGECCWDERLRITQ